MLVPIDDPAVTRALVIFLSPVLACAECWKAAGSPFPKTRPTALELHEAEVKIRERMAKRRGNSAYVVRSGKS